MIKDGLSETNMYPLLAKLITLCCGWRQYVCQYLIRHTATWWIPQTLKCINFYIFFNHLLVFWQQHILPTGLLVGLNPSVEASEEVCFG